MKKQNFIILAALLIGLAVSGFSQTGIQGQKDEKRELTDFIRSVYKWHETASSNDDFNAITGKPKESKDSLFTGIDWVAHKNRMKELEATGYFAKDFLENYNNIAVAIDKELKSGAQTWLLGEMPPYGNDANPWCNCQDNPDKYWETMTVKIMKRTENSTKLKWTWDNKFFYGMTVIKVDDSWKIQYLQGFDFKKYMHQKN